MLSSIGALMNKSKKVPSQYSCTPLPDNAFWRTYDKIAVVVRSPAFFWTSVGLLVFGTILGVIAPYL